MNHYLIRYSGTTPEFPNDISELQTVAIANHFEYLKNLLDEGKLILAGRTEDAEIGIAIILAHDDTEAQTIFENDPAVLNGIFQGTVKPFSLALMK